MERKERQLLLQAAIALVELKPPLNMECFRSDSNGYAVDQKGTAPCGSAGCFLGWCPFLGVEGLGLVDDFVNGGTGVTWECYSRRVFGMNPFSREWAWCFDLNWPDSHAEVLERVKYLVVNGSPPDGYGRGLEDEFFDFDSKISLERAKKVVGLV